MILKKRAVNVQSQNAQRGLQHVRKFKRLGNVWAPKVILGDIREVFRFLIDNSVDCLITSPPYWMQRDYRHPDQIGREKEPDEYVEQIVTVFEKLRPKLKKTATIFLNVGYKYLNGELILIPEMIALEMMKRGFILKNKIIWWKPNAMPTPARDRFNDMYEPVLFFTRDDGREVHYFDLEEISQKSKTLDHYANLLSIRPEQLLGAKVVDPFSTRERRQGKAVGTRSISNNPIEICIKWDDDTEEWKQFGDPLRSYPEKVSFSCPSCRWKLDYWNIILSFANSGKLVCSECQANLCENSHTFPAPRLRNAAVKENAKIREITDFGAEKKKYITRVPKSSKFLKAEMEEISMASPAGRLAIQGEYLTIKRRWDAPQLLIAAYLKYWRECSRITIENIDNELGYSYTAGHWFRQDFGRWGRGGSIPRPDDWNRLKNLLKFDNTYDRLVTEAMVVLQTVKPHEGGKNPGDVWKITLEQYSGGHFSIFPTGLVEFSMKAGCPPGGVVLDPFAGSGTVGEVATKLGRKSILIELVPEFLDLMKKRLRDRIDIVQLDSL